MATRRIGIIGISDPTDGPRDGGGGGRREPKRKKKILYRDGPARQQLEN
jgi:hypothetical protein